MNYDPVIERYGNLLKREMLVSMEEKILPNTFVLEAPEPFPGFFGYYNDVPLDAKPLYVYFVLKRLYTLEEVTRAYQKIRVNFVAPNMHAAAGTVELHGEVFHVLRIRHLDTYDQVAELQAAFANEGFEFAKKSGRTVNETGVIRIKKFFLLKEIAPGMYLDLTEADHGYFVLPRMLPWAEFEEITQQVKFNWDRPSFDAAIGHFHHNFEIIDMIRIYNPQIDLAYLTDARDKYLTRIK